MQTHFAIYMPALAVALVTLALWVAIDRALQRRIRSRLRAFPLCLPLLLAALGYGLYWWAFFASPAMAVQMYAIRLTLQHEVGAWLPWIAGGWAALALYALRPLVTRGA